MVWWGFGLLLGACVILALELFVPSGGILGLVAAALGIASVVCFWRVSPTWGVSSLVAFVVLAPMAVAFFVKIWPDTPMGRKMILADDDSEIERRTMLANEVRTKEDSLIGAQGRAITDLRPVGMVELDGQRVEALAEGSWIEAGQPVRVTHVEGARIKVRPAHTA
jgi:membrane-bound ClpP family serine protease